MSTNDTINISHPSKELVVFLEKAQKEKGKNGGQSCRGCPLFL